MARSFFTFIICCVSCFLFTLLFLIENNALHYAEGLESRFEIAVFMKPGTPEPEVAGEKIRSAGGVDAVRFISGMEAAGAMKEFAEEVMLTEEMPFPDSFSVRPGPMTASGAEAAAEEIRGIEGVDEVVFNRELITMIERAHAVSSCAGISAKVLAALVCAGMLAAVLAGVRGQVKAGRALRAALPGVIAAAAVTAVVYAVYGKAGGIPGRVLLGPEQAAVTLFTSAVVSAVSGLTGDKGA